MTPKASSTWLLCCLLSGSTLGVCQPRIETVAGGYVPSGVLGRSAPMGTPYALGSDVSGNLYVVSLQYHTVFRVDPSGVVAIIAGTGSPGFSEDGIPGINASLIFPRGVAADPVGNVFISDTGGNRVRRVDAVTGQITTIIGDGVPGFTGDGGPSGKARLSQPYGLTIDSAGNVYIADKDNHRIRRIEFSTGLITTVAGNGQPGFMGDDGLATQASLSGPTGIAVDAAGNIYIADSDNHRIRRVDAKTGVITTVAGTGSRGYGGDGDQATQATLNFPYALYVDAGKSIWIADSANARVRKIDGSTGIITTVAGNGVAVPGPDGGPATNSTLTFPRGVALDRSGNLYIADGDAHRVRRVDANTGLISTAVGNGSNAYTGDDITAAGAGISFPRGVGVDILGNVYIADTDHQRIRRVDVATGIISSVAGDGFAGFSGDAGSATSARLAYPFAVTADAEGNLFIADTFSNHVRRIDNSTGRISTIAGTGGANYSGDGGPAVSAGLNFPTSVAVDRAGNVYVADQRNHRVRRIDSATGRITTFAGDGQARFQGDGGAAASASLSSPTTVAVDLAGNVFIADTGNQRIRRVDAVSGRISTIVGNGNRGFAGDNGPAANASVNDPHGVAIDAAGNIYFTDTVNHRVRFVDVSTGRISTVAGTGRYLYSGDGGPATAATFTSPRGIAVDGAGNIYVADTDGSRVRRISPVTATTFELSTRLLKFTSRTGAPPTAEQSILITASAGTPLRVSTTGEAWLRASASGVAAPATVQVSVNPAGLAPGTYRAAIVITAGFSSQSVAVNFTVSAAPTLSVSPFSLNFNTTTQASQTLKVSNTGGTLNFLASSDASWLTISPVAGTSPADLSVTVNADGYRSGSYNATITITAGDSSANPLKVPVSLIVPSAPPSSGALVILQDILTFSYQLNGPQPPAQDIVVSTGGGSVDFHATSSVSAGSVSAWLSATPADGTAPGVIKVNVDPTGLTPGAYEGNVIVAAQSGSPISVPVRLTVIDPTPAKLVTDLDRLNFVFTQAESSDVRQLTLTNPSANPVDFRVAAQTGDSSGWLKVSKDTGAVGASQPATLLVSANPETRDPGTYSGMLRLSASTGDSLDVPVTMTVSRNSRRLVVSQTALSFTVVAGSGVNDLPQDFAVINAGQGAMPWTAGSKTESGPGRWLSVNTDNGVSVAGTAVTSVRVSVDGTGMQAGEYHGEVLVSAAGADNSPYTVPVLMRVLPAGSYQGPQLYPSGVIFTAVAGGPSPAEESVLIINRSGKSTKAVLNSITLDNGRWLNFSPSSLDFSGLNVGRGVVGIRVDTTGMAQGIYEGRVSISFPGGVNRVVNVLLVIGSAAGAGNAAAGNKESKTAVAGCTPTRYVPLFTSIEDQFSVSAGAAASTRIVMVDDCGNPVPKASVGATFSNRDRSLNLSPLGDGRWTATWLPANNRESTVAVQVTAVDTEQQVAQGGATVTGFIRDNTTAPLLDRSRGVVNGASLRASGLSAPGTLISLFGERLAAYRDEARSIPLPARLGETTVRIGERELPLISVSPDRIDAILPYDLEGNTTQQLVVRRGATLSSPDTVIIADAQPGIFTQDRSGRGRGMIYVLNEGAEPQLVTTESPATAGSRILIQCTGLGIVDPAPQAGTQASRDPAPRVVAPVSLTIGGVAAEVRSAVLDPDRPGVYSVVAVVPSEIQPSGEAQVVLKVAGQSSPPVTTVVR